MKMKDKKAAQIEAKRKHIASLAAAKAGRRVEPILKRGEPTRIEKPLILIVCEGKNTEPSYFRQFKLTSATIKAIGKGFNTTSLVNHAILLSQQYSYDQVWCVFDRDQFPANDFNNAIAIATASEIGVAYSNQAFEYWLILHLEDHQGGGMNRSEYGNKINDYLKAMGSSYEGDGSKLVTDVFFEILNGIDPASNRSRIELAITRAKRNYDFMSHLRPADAESSTTVFKLVEEILKYV